MTTPDIAGVHHVTLSVSDAAASADWYREILGFTILRHFTAEGLTKAMITRAGVTIVLVAHGELAVPGPFDERRTGLDHLSFAVADAAQLEKWAARLDAAGITRSAVKQGSTGSLLAFRDPDNIALEFYTL